MIEDCSWEKFRTFEETNRFWVWTRLWNLLEKINGSRSALGDNANLNLWGAIALLWDELDNGEYGLTNLVVANMDRISELEKKIESMRQCQTKKKAKTLPEGPQPAPNPAHKEDNDLTERQQRVYDLYKASTPYNVMARKLGVGKDIIVSEIKAIQRKLPAQTLPGFRKDNGE